MKNIRKEIAVWVQFGAFVVIWIVVLRLYRIELRINWEALKRAPEVIALYSVFHLLFTSWGWRFRFSKGG